MIESEWEMAQPQIERPPPINELDGTIIERMVKYPLEKQLVYLKSDGSTLGHLRYNSKGELGDGIDNGINPVKVSAQLSYLIHSGKPI